MSKYLLSTMVLFGLGHIFIWFQLYSHYVWEWWENKPIHAVLIFGVPASIFFLVWH